MKLETVLHPPLLTGDLPGLGGQIKTVPEDFEVEEIPAYEPSGSGEFLYLWLEKRDMGAEYFLRQISRRLEISERDIGSAGLKDRQAVTRQWVSVPASVETRLTQLEGDGITVLKVDRHTNKLKTGHLRGNRFRILIRNPSPEEDVAAFLSPIVERLTQMGLPNFYGAQRFGNDGETALQGLALLRGEEPPTAASGKKPNLKNPFLKKLALSAAQSAMFNVYLSQRIQDGFFRQVLAGDVMSKWPQGGLFVAEDVDQEQKRFDSRETVTTGPIFGKKTFPAKNQAAERESAILSQADLPETAFAGFGKLMPGTRRHNLLYIDDLKFSQETDGIRLTFSLPSGSYATVLLREIMKGDYGVGED